MKIALIGFGRFGRLLNDILKNDQSITTFDKDDPLEHLDRFDVIFLTIPIHEFESIIQKIALQLKPGTTVIDTCSVKLYPTHCMTTHLGHDITIIATHPLFGPDSYYQSQDNRMMMHFVRGDKIQYDYWKQYFSQKNIRMIEMTPDDHDRYAAYSQGLTHLIGRVLQKADIKPTPIDTLGFTQLLKIMNQTCHDSLELFHDLQAYNPYTKECQETIKKAFTALINP